jgi:hypothetical protein
MGVKEVYMEFANFGGGNAKTDEMDNVKFAKLAKDCKLLSKKVTKTDIDLIFTKVKPKGARKINFESFEKALEEIAKKSGVELSVIQEKVSSGGAASSGTKAEMGGIYDKLTDTSQYTGAHQARFDEDGKGRGLDGRDMGGENPAGNLDRSAVGVRGV